jgi:RNA polymerase sigma-54 factor
MALELKQTVKLSQQLVMTPQLQMAIKLLTLNRLELQDAINAELVENPVLEAEYGDLPAEGTSEAREARDAKEAQEANQASEAPDKVPEVQMEQVGTDKQQDNRSEIDWEAYADSYSYLPPAAGSGRDFAHDDLPGVDQTLTRAETLEEHLLWQIQMSGMNTLEREIAVRLIGEMNDDGYLDMSPRQVQEGHEESLPALADADADPDAGIAADLQGDEAEPPARAGRARRKTTLERLRELAGENETQKAPPPAQLKDKPAVDPANDTVALVARELEVPLEWVENVRHRVMRMDPPGCLSRDLREVLLIQLEIWGYDDDCLVYNLVDRHLPQVHQKKYKAIARALNVTMEDIGDALHIIEQLEPKPGRNFLPAGETAESQYITPDVYVHKMGDEYVVVANEDGLPKLQISRFYLDQLRSKKRGDPSKNFIKEKMRSATWLIRSIHQRQRTICRVVESILKFQRPWFDGTGPLKPLVLRDVADDIEMHESTVSRVTTRKYVHTHRGVYELKYFFNSSIGTGHGAAIASEAVKDEIKKIIGDEDPKKPLSDAAIVKMLKAKDIDIARRTVAKYREMLGILPSSKRRQVF